MKSKTYILIITCLTFASISCSTNSNKSKPQPKGKNKISRVPARVMPGGNGDNWRYLGLSKDGLVGVEIDDSSIKPVDTNKYSFQERKTIMDTKIYTYPYNTTKYTYSISSWQINCNSKSYVINTIALYDQLGKPINNTMQFNGTTELSAKNNSIAWQEYNYICNGIGRNIGY